MDPGTETITVVHIDDDEGILDVTKRSLEQEHPKMEVVSFLDQHEALDHLDDADCVVTDYHMDGMDGLDLLEAVRQRDPDLPVVFFTGRGSEEVATEAFKLGVTDYLKKGPGPQQYVVLGNRIRILVAKHRAEQAADEAAARIQHIYNRIGEAYIAVDDDWTVTYLNAAAETLLVESDSFEYGDDLWTLFEDDEDLRMALYRAMEDRTPVSVDSKVPVSERWMEIRAYPSPDGLSVFGRDVTEELVKGEALDETLDRLESAESRFRALRDKMSRPPRRF